MNRTLQIGVLRKFWLATLLSTAGLIGCAGGTTAQLPESSPAAISATFGPVEQSAITPDDALTRLKDGNARFVAGNSLQRDYSAQIKATSSGQYPFAAVLSCMDSRSTPEIVFDQGIGDLFVCRVAGNYAPTDVIGSLEYATKVAGAKLIVVMGHTECGAIKGACDNVQLGNLSTVIDALQPAVNDVQNVDGDRNSKNKKFVRLVTEANVRRTVAKLRSDSPILHDLEVSGELKIVGAIQDISTGQVTFFDWNDPTTPAAQ
jgi:carbonic anhydrase